MNGECEKCESGRKRKRMAHMRKAAASGARAMSIAGLTKWCPPDACVSSGLSRILRSPSRGITSMRIRMCSAHHTGGGGDIMGHNGAQGQGGTEDTVGMQTWILGCGRMEK